MSSGYENRRFERSEVLAPVSLELVGGQTAHGQMVNLSLVGIYVVGLEPLPVGAECTARIVPSAPLEPVTLRGRVMHRNESGMGIEITGIESGSFECLRTLIVENAEDAFSCEAQIVANMALIPELF
jgi:hypothetical protein